MSDFNLEDDKILYNISIKFVNSLFQEEYNLSNNSLKRSFKNNNKDLYLYPKIFKQNLSRDKINKRNKNSTLQTTGKNKMNIISNKDNSNNKILLTEKTTKSSISNYFPTTTTQLNKNNKNKTKQNYYTMNTNDSFTYEIYKAKQESLKEKKLYEERVKVLRNHINALKKQEEELNKKVEINKEKEKNKNKARQEKDILKQALLSIEIDKRNALEQKKKNIIQQKQKINLGLKESQKKNINEKIKKYKEMYNDRKKVEEKRNEIKNKKEENNLTQIKKIKNEREKFKEKNKRKKNEDINRINNSYRKTYQNNINETKKLKDELKNLELMEEECIQKLKKTQEYIKKNNDENIRFNNYQKIKFSYDIDNKIRRNANSAQRRNQNISINNLSRNKKDKASSALKLNYE